MTKNLGSTRFVPRHVRAAFPVFFLLLGIPTVDAFAQTPVFTPGNLVVLVEGCGVSGGTCTSVPNGTGTGSLNSSAGGYGDNQATPVTLFQFTPNATASAAYVNSLVLPQVGSGANVAVSGEYGSSSEGGLQLSGSGQYLTLGTYGINAATFNAANATTYGDTTTIPALAQTGSLTAQTTYNPVPRVVTLVDAYGNVNSSTPVFNIFNTNNPRSVYSANGTTAYLSGQGSGSDATGGVFYVPSLGAANSAPTAITGLDTTSKTVSQDTRFVTVFNNTLYVSADTKGGSNNARSFVGTLGTPPSTSLFNSSAGPTQLASTNNAATPVSVTSTGKVTLTASETNGINAAGLQINTSPSAYFFANATTLYIADTGNPKQDSATSPLGDGGLQKWVYSSSTSKWVLQYTMAAGLNLVANPNASSPANTSGTTGLYGLTGVVSGSNVYLYATNATIADLDQTYLYGITDTLAATTNPGTSFTVLATAPADSNFKGVSLAPSLPAGSATLHTVPDGLQITTAGTGCAAGTYTTPVTLAWTPSNTCQLSVASSQTVAGSTYVFSKWQDNTTATTDSVTAPATAATFTATFNALPTPVIVWSPSSTTGSANVPIGSGVLDATSTTPGTFAYTRTPAGTPQPITASSTLPPGVYTLTATFTPSSPTTYSPATATISYTVINQSVFVANTTGSVSSVFDNGTTQSSSVSGGGIGLAVDNSGYVWSISTNQSGVTKFTDAGLLSVAYTPTGMSGATALAIDGAGTVWFAQGGTSNNVYALSNGGTPSSTTGLAQAGSLNTPASLSVDTAGSLWIANSGNNTVTEVIGVAAPVATPTVTQVVKVTPGARP